MGKHTREHTIIDIMTKIIFWLSITLTCLGIDGICKDIKIMNIQQQINEIKFEQSYLEYVKEDGERQ